ncbi:hypothetical protein OUZ56_031315 [Daphnia magna]|uniref:Uncharacterized protein n=1 Tax=Daphnia magna TaxID=35525 RepID=A0ABQ9ZUD3_9CRUS|nr:hypothetical protein OUZ56_031315 [Daphnia magna]
MAVFHAVELLCLSNGLYIAWQSVPEKPVTTNENDVRRFINSAAIFELKGTELRVHSGRLISTVFNTKVPRLFTFYRPPSYRDVEEAALNDDISQLGDVQESCELFSLVDVDAVANWNESTYSHPDSRK